MIRAGRQGYNEAGYTRILGIFPTKFTPSNSVRQEVYPSWPALSVIIEMECVCREDSALAAGSLRAKEPQYFNRWPLPPVGDYLHAWHSGVIGAMVSDSAGRRVLMDASPQYLMNAAAPARIQAVMPHAKFIMVVRVRLASPQGPGMPV